MRNQTNFNDYPLFVRVIAIIIASCIFVIAILMCINSLTHNTKVHDVVSIIAATDIIIFICCIMCAIIRDCFYSICKCFNHDTTNTRNNIPLTA